MKTLLLTLVAAAGIAFAAEAQTVSVGPRIGATFAKINFSGEDGDSDFNEAIKANAGLQFGAVANFAVNDMFSVQPELLYVQKGYKISEEGMTLKLKANYLEVPVLAKASFGSDSYKVFFTAGPSVGYWMSGKSSFEYDGDEVSEDYEFEDGDNRTELGANIGAGIAYPVSSGTVNLDVRYGFGLSSLYSDDQGDAKAKNRVFGVSVAYLFSL
ncbi:porin family protein [Pontibacter mangrovi]|uniref:PorT family protein n=1 Tax=Pontibacter mangrovi TaxID=2589816 RepID=A0A501W4H6_9BACT|nr:porin family protein [Pontibacter mangrovi]TPE44489.1 PorT family protein [Pontibacter mangrovi]